MNKIRLTFAQLRSQTVNGRKKTRRIEQLKLAKMKYLVTLIIMCCHVAGFSQSLNPDLFQTWYLYKYGSTDNNVFYPVSEVTPSIAPNITFTETFDFYGVGACNLFNGTFSSPYGNDLLFDNFNATLMLCDSSQQTSYEGRYFSFMQNNSIGYYQILGQGDQMTLIISTPIFVDYIFGNSQLNTPTFDLKQTLVYPNPFDSQLQVESLNILITKIEIFNALGQMVKLIDHDFDLIPTTDFPSGVYFIKLFSGEKSVTKKMIKK